jgi:DNA ligase-1
MNRFAELLDRLAYEPRRLAKMRLLSDYFSTTPDPDRGYGLAAITGTLDFLHAKPALIRHLIATRTDPILFELSYDYVGDLSETVALMWPKRVTDTTNHALGLGETVMLLSTASKTELPALLANLLDRLDETGRWALLKLITGGLRIGVSARLAKTALANMAGFEVDAIEQVWHGLEPPFEGLFRWLEGKGPQPSTHHPAPFRPVMLGHALEENDLRSLNASDFVAEWKWDGIRVQASSGLDSTGAQITRLYSRTGDDISSAFPDVIEALTGLRGTLDGELLVIREGKVESFNALQQRLNRKKISLKLLSEYPAAIRAYDVLWMDGTDLRERPFHERRMALEGLIERLNSPRLDLSPMIRFDNWESLEQLRSKPEESVSLADAEAIEGCMIKRRDSPYVAGRPKGLWFKWKRDPFIVDAVLMYAQRGHGKRSSFYSDFTFGVWKGDELVPVGKSYFGFTDQELGEIDRFVRKNTINRFGPVREVSHEADLGLVFEVAFEGIGPSTRHRSGLAMRFPRISRLRWDKPPREADTLETLEALANQGRKKT